MIIDNFLDKLGLVRKTKHVDEIEKLCHKCEEFAKDYLDYTKGVTIGSEPGEIVGGVIDKPSVVIGSGVKITGSQLRGLCVAPWVNYTVLENVISTDKPPETVVRALVRSQGPFSITGNR